MKKTLIATTLRIIPKTLQNKALCKALNYALAKENLSALQDQIIKLNVNDLKRSWFVTYDGIAFIPTKKRKTTLEIKTKFNTAMQLGNKDVIINALQQGDIELIGEGELVEATHGYLSRLDSDRLDNISSHLFSFLNIKTKPRLDINSVQLNDLKNNADVDFIRDEALKIEKTDLKKALSLMTLAHQARPNGPFIKQKVAEYQNKLN
ncbi:hypothetical protein [Psychromonas sp. SA13A]|uniref:hypothetical protein n=1 Tax=Psychromonas sp. SA13A TaxID=2686346 RepID=UPI001407BA82|nr:hypothetical protein [Psychromonas sp. SA13A]